MTRVLVTGAAGFIGSHLADRFHADGHTVAGVDNLTTGRESNFGGELVVEDITNRDVFYGLANAVKPDLIVHCAASYSNPDYWHRDTQTNVLGTINATVAAKHHGARLIYFQTALPPISSYAISKIAGEQYIGLADVEATVFRLANIYGPRNVSGPVPTFARRIFAGDDCTVVNTARDMVYVGDLVDAVMLSTKANARGKFDICSGVHVPIEGLYRAVADELGCTKDPKRIEASKEDVKQMDLDPSPARLQLGWKARTPFADGIKSAVDWYRGNPIGDTYSHLVMVND